MIGNNAVIYARKSTSKQKEISIEGQLRECTEFCDARNYNVIATYIDRAQSGRHLKRDNFQRMLEDAKKGGFSVVVVYKYNRFFRNRDEATLCRRELRKYGVKLLAVRDPIPEGRGGIYYEAFLDADAEAYSVGLSEDTARGMLDAAKLLQVTGPCPLGYRRGEDGRYEIDPAEADIVRRAFEMYAEGSSIPDICATFNNEGLTTKTNRKFQTTSIAAIFRNVKYMGIYKYKDVVSVENGCPAIVSSDLFVCVSQRLQKMAGIPAKGKAIMEFYLTSKLFCGKCHKPMFGDSGSGRKFKYYYYTCSTRRKERTCDKKSVKKEVLEEAVLDGALSVLTNENIAIIAEEAERIALKESENKKILLELQKEEREIEKEITNISKAISAGIITETTKELLLSAEQQRRDIKNRIMREEALAEKIVPAETIAAWLYKFKNGDRSNHEFKRSVFDLLVREIYLYDDDPGEGYVIIWCNVSKGQEIRIDLSKYGSDMVQSGEPETG